MNDASDGSEKCTVCLPFLSIDNYRAFFCIMANFPTHPATSIVWWRSVGKQIFVKHVVLVIRRTGWLTRLNWKCVSTLANKQGCKIWMMTTKFPEENIA